MSPEARRFLALQREVAAVPEDARAGAQRTITQLTRRGVLTRNQCFALTHMLYQRRKIPEEQ